MGNGECNSRFDLCARNFVVAAEIVIDPDAKRSERAEDNMETLFKSGAYLDSTLSGDTLDAKLFCGICSDVITITPITKIRLFS